ncbi:MAG: hypothetical protein KDA58_14975, partial [Planctomycetaceae bacterium]|nr:hypothetical protein [Planctomycetaceae bacterium]
SVMFAVVDLDHQATHLYRVVLGIFQPLFFLVLVFGFVLASAHLLTMIATRWGDRRTSSKALFFSVAVHVLLGCGIVAMIPEYRERIFARLAELEEIPFEIQSPPLDPADEQVAHLHSGSVPVFNRLPELPPQEMDRFEMPAESASPEAVVQPESEPTPFLPIPTGDSTPLPIESSPTPQLDQIHAANNAQPQQAQDMVRPEQIEVQPREEQPAASALNERQRTQPSTATEVIPQQVDPRPGMVELVKPEFDLSRDSSSIPLESSPLASLQRAPETNDIMRREGPAPASPEVEMMGRDQTGRPNPTVSASPISPNLSRTQPRAPSAAPSMEVQRFRPPTAPAFPNPIIERPDSTLSGIDRMQLPVPEVPQLARALGDSFVRSFEQIPSAYQLRSDEKRQRALMEFGGSEDSEAAVDRSLRWLASVQSSAGFWDASANEAGTIDQGPDGQSRRFAGRNADTGVTGLAILAFLGNRTP